MANKGETKIQKKLSVAKARFVARKGGGRFTLASRAGPHSKATSVPLGFVVRDMLGLAKNKREAKAVLGGGSITVNGAPSKDLRLAIGLFDLIGVVPAKKNYRVVFDRKGRLRANEIPLKGKAEKLSRVASKKTVRGGIFQVTTNDGYTFREKKTDLKMGDTVMLELPEKKVARKIEMKKGNLAYVLAGRHVGKEAKIVSIISGTVGRPKLVELEGKEGAFTTLEKNIMVIGERKPEIEIGKTG